MMNMKTMMKKSNNETDKQFIFRICKMKDELGYTWQQIADVLNEELGNNYGESCYRKQFQSFNGMFEANANEFVGNNDEYLKQIQAEKDELYKLKKQMQDQRREYNKLLTSDARAEHLNEKMIEVAEKIALMKPLQFDSSNNRTYGNDAVLVINDIHYGLITDNIWNCYNKSICVDRLQHLVEKVIINLRTHKVDTLHVLLLGDCAHGAIHTSARVASEEDTCDQLMQISEIIAEMIAKLSTEVNYVKVYSTYGNHLRTIQKKEDSIHSDNMEKIVPWWLKQRFKGCEKIEIIDSDYYEFIYLNVKGYNIVATHGDLDNVKNCGLVLNTLFTKQYNKSIDYIILADKHHIEEFEQFGIDATISGAVCGTDEYANNRRLYSIPSQSLMIFNREDGKLCTYNIRLDK